MIVPKRGNMVDGLEKINVSFYAKEMSNSDIEEQIRSLVLMCLHQQSSESQMP